MRKVSQLEAIEELSEKIGKEITEITDKETSLRGAHFARVKEDIISLVLTGLNLKTLPIELGALIELNVLDLSKNNFREVPTVLQKLPKLAVLNLSSNQLYSLPEWLGNFHMLKVLSLANNNLRSLPATIENLTLLRKIFLQGNDLQRLPFSLTNLKHLAEIHLDFRTAMRKNVKAVLTALEANGCHVNAHYNRR
ncbi:MAG: hypothetical protein DRP02_04825 [Candidatus Gerdarchaeota archaeon]|nr:MAG: hypothetical protein DRP02_04825 [Candidatus Gerdarchaeota archaeon]